MSKKGLKGLPNYKFLGSSTKGLSDVVTTLIIILISLVAIGLVWVVVQNVLQEIRAAQKQFSLQQLKAKLKNHAVVKDINPEKKTVTIELR